LLPQPPNNFFSDTIAGCQPLPVYFNESSPNQGQTYYWDFNDENNNGYSTQKSPMHLFEEDGIYDITLTVTGFNGCKNIITKKEMISVFEKPTARFSSYPTTVSIIDPYIYFENVSSTTFISNWDFGDGSHSSDNNPYYKYKAQGNYSVQLIAETEHACKDTTFQNIIVNDESTFYAPNAFTPDNDGMNDIFFVVGKGIDPESFQLFIYDRWGGLIYKHSGYDIENPELSGWNGTVNNGSEIGINGVYAWLVIFKNKNGIEFTKAGHVTLIH
jgi:gliding motility-associated-like protein